MAVAAGERAGELGLEVVAERWVPGALECPLALQRLLARDDIAGAVLLGIIERGETQHGLAMGQAVVQAVLDLQLATGKPVGMGVIGPGAEPQHIEPRLLPYARKAVDAVAEMLNFSA
ncbi:MAG: 6,7-dimethyl-8-ribityllumazine synthase [Candidatus Poseidoniia archaeon]|jgi:6,7-dimethyl-8-ribityllumazine synthase|nr:6,7-dimethyl-8-ribityllumazine synthase [Candidatus Poseidoniia archaeon]MDP6846345.1 6,7-dimethyl-8-ribityllumazine synthase [Candidatus Poseidoniia archaeon]MDP7006623.1 6,7-dimethyl-8-ribityllumazine synthase [Candidatus Poseidoniia archaeon]|tara:strand:+ start:172 stop:525 length:354 start_codon:yes stop_codon:yes gene_type:complete